MKCLKLGLLVIVLGAPASALAQPDPEYVDRYDSSVGGEPVASVDVFYDQLSPYGVWVDDPDFAQVFIPDQKQFVPYTQGHWQYTSVGFVWISAEPFDWATAHYGRWAYSRSYGRWVWHPDTVWGPSWVEWRQSGDDFGWAPLAPQVAVNIGYSPPVESWHYCAAAHVLDANVTRYYEPPRRVIEIHREARPIEHYAQISGARVVVGPSASTLHEHHVTARPTPATAIAVRATGRLAPTEARVAVTRAQEHHAANEVQNRKRIESNPAVRQVQAHVAVAAPQRAEGKPAAAPPQVKQEPRPPQGQPEHKQPAPPQRAQTQPEPRQPEHKQPAPPQHAQPQPEPRQPEHKQPAPPPQHAQPQPEPRQPEHKQPAPPQHAQPQPAPPQHAQPQPEPRQPAPPEHKQPAPPQHAQPQPAPPQHAQPQPAPPQHAQPQPAPPQHAQPQPEPRQPAPPEHKQPQAAPEHRPPQAQPEKRPDPDHKRDDK